MKSALCPSCGAPVVFRSAASVFAVCEYCKSTLVREDDMLKRIGRMAELLEDNSPLQIGSEGRYRGRNFTLVGRIQLKYEAGVWNEWYALFDDGSDGWLSDASGEMTMTFKVGAGEKTPPGSLPDFLPAVPPFADLQVGQEIRFGKTDGKGAKNFFVVTNLERALVVAAAGELPHGVTSGYEAPVADLRGRAEQNETPVAAGGARKNKPRKDETQAGDTSADVVPDFVPFASIDYSDTPPSVFVGESLPFAALKLSRLKEGAAFPEADQRLKVRAFQCPGCGAPLSMREEIVTVACAGCGTVIDSENETLKALKKARGEISVPPDIPLGSKGRFGNDEYEVIGFLVQETKVDGMTYWWREYLLHCPRAGFRWLTEYDGHWNFVAPLSRVPGGETSRKTLGGVEYALFQTTTARIAQVMGEFYWRVRQGDESTAEDYVAPPYVLSCERTDKEITWSRGAYIEGGEVWRALGLKGSPPAKKGVGANQPSPYATQTTKVYLLCLVLAALAIAVQFGLKVFDRGGARLLVHDMKFIPATREEAGGGAPTAIITSAGFAESSPQPLDRAYVAAPAAGSKLSFTTLRTPVFHFGGGHLLVRDRATIDDNRWFGFDLTLVNRETGKEIQSYRELYRASGSDSDGPWSEYKTNDEIVFRSIDAGDYYFLVDAESGADTAGAFSKGREDSLNLQVFPAEPGWGNWWLFNGFLGAMFLFAGWRREAFEVRRWSESDHPRVSLVSILQNMTDNEE